MAKSGKGDIAGAGRRKGEWVGWDEGLTASDRAGLQVIADHTDEVIEALGAGIARALEAIGIEAEGDAAAICPVDTGRLRNSITHTIDADEKVAIIGSNVEYALAVHEGTSTRKGNPFLVTAVNTNRGKYTDIARAAFES